jgi:integrase
MGTLTVDKVKRISQPGRYGDGGGLYLVVSPGLTKSWVLRLQQDGKRTDKGLGGFPAVSLSAARRLAVELRAAVQQGQNPWAKPEKRAAMTQAAARSGMTFKQAAGRCQAVLADRWRSEKTAVMWEQSLAKHVMPLIGAMRIDQITGQDVRAVLEPIWKEKAEQARKVKQRIRMVFDWAVDMELRESNPVGAFRFALPPQPTLVNGHHRALPFQKVRAALKRLKRQRLLFDPHPRKVTLLCLEFLILTATRSAEARGARWEEIDMYAGVWTIPASRMKMGRPHRVPLSHEANRVLWKAREKLGGKSGLEFPFTGLVFPTPDGNPLSGHCLSHRLRRDETGCVPHGFRSSFRDWAAEKSGASREAIELALAHTVGGAVETAYFRSDLLEQRRPLMDAWGEYVSPQAKSPF